MATRERPASVSGWGNGFQPEGQSERVLARHSPFSIGATDSDGARTEFWRGTTHEHTLHKLAAGLDTLAAVTPLVLVLEDVHLLIRTRARSVSSRRLGQFS